MAGFGYWLNYTWQKLQSDKHEPSSGRGSGGGGGEESPNLSDCIFHAHSVFERERLFILNTEKKKKKKKWNLKLDSRRVTKTAECLTDNHHKELTGWLISWHENSLRLHNNYFEIREFGIAWRSRANIYEKYFAFSFISLLPRTEIEL